MQPIVTDAAIAIFTRTGRGDGSRAPDAQGRRLFRRESGSIYSFNRRGLMHVRPLGSSHVVFLLSAVLGGATVSALAQIPPPIRDR